MTTTTRPRSTARAVHLVRRPRDGEPGALRLTHYTADGRTATEYLFRECEDFGFDGRAFTLCRLHACEFDPAPEVFVMVSRDGAFSDPHDAEGRELVDAVKAVLAAGLI